MVNFADAVTKISYGKLMTTTPNAKGVEKVLQNSVKSSCRELSTLCAENAMFSMGAKGESINNPILAKYCSLQAPLNLGLGKKLTSDTYIKNILSKPLSKEESAKIAKNSLERTVKHLKDLITLEIILSRK